MNKKAQHVNPLSIVLYIFVLLFSIVGINHINIKQKTIEINKKQENTINNNNVTIKGIIKNTDKDIVYLAKGDYYQLHYLVDSNSPKAKNKLTYSSSNYSIASVDQDGLIYAKGNGEATIYISIQDYEEKIKVISSDLILPINNDLIYDKDCLECGKYTKEENDLLDTILLDRIKTAGYKTRAGVVAAMRFLLLEFPYRINYFFENGRQGYYADGEGRYYFKGLYLNDSRYSNLKKSSETGPACWGCKLYSNTAKKDDINGLDCSGLVTWALLNGGYDPGDVGAGGNKYPKDSLYFIGKRENNKLENIINYKAGDLVHNEKAGGHIGMIVGIDESYVYVAQAIWYKPIGVNLTKYSYEDFVKEWKSVILMDDYYKDDGSYTKMWN